MKVATEGLVFPMKITLSNEALLWFKDEMEADLVTPSAFLQDMVDQVRYRQVFHLV